MGGGGTQESVHAITEVLLVKRRRCGVQRGCPTCACCGVAAAVAAVHQACPAGSEQLLQLVQGGLDSRCVLQHVGCRVLLLWWWRR